jgi:hypothetical protein
MDLLELLIVTHSMKVPFYGNNLYLNTNTVYFALFVSVIGHFAVLLIVSG